MVTAGAMECEHARGKAPIRIKIHLEPLHEEPGMHQPSPTTAMTMLHDKPVLST